MKKLSLVLGALILVPTLSIAASICEPLNDNEYKSNLQGHSPFITIKSEANYNITATTHFNSGNTYIKLLDVTAPFGKGTISVNGTWDVNNAVLSMHTVSATYAPVTDQRLRVLLGSISKTLITYPDRRYRLDKCQDPYLKIN